MALAYHNIGVAYLAKGKDGLALAHHQEAFRIRKLKLGPDWGFVVTVVYPSSSQSGFLRNNYFALDRHERFSPSFAETSTLSNVVAPSMA